MMNDSSQDKYPYTEKFKKECKDVFEDVLRTSDATWVRLTVYFSLFAILGFIIVMFSLGIFS